MITKVFPGHATVAAELERLATEIRQLWSSRPAIDDDAREPILIELTQLDLTVELLRLRGAAGHFEADDWAATQEVTAALADLHRHWPTLQAVG